MRKSLWQEDIKNNRLEKIKTNKTTDILIIGAGITGVTTAYNLIDSKYNVILIDSFKCFNSTTAKSTGKITYLQDLIYQKIIKASDFDTAKLYLEAQKDAIKIIKKNIKEKAIDCDLEKCSCVTFTNDLKEIKNFKLEKEFFDKIGINYFTKIDDLDEVKYKALLGVNNTYVFNPVKYLNGLLENILKSSNIKVFENSIATKIRKEKNNYVVIVNDCEIKASKIVLACNFPFFTIPGFVPLKTYVEKSYVAATKVDKTKKISGITSNYPTLSFRYNTTALEKYFIFLSNSSKICDSVNYKKNYDETILKTKKITGKKPNYIWTNMDVLTHDSLPLIGRISKSHPNVFIATGYNTWGMTNGSIAGKIISSLLKNKKSKYAEIFDPSRSTNLNKIGNFISNTFISNIKAYGFNLIKKNPSWYKDKAFVTKIDGKRVGVYFDKEGNKHVVSNICPHLKCFLTFNEVDKTWDCPCHGSRFDIDGNRIKGPSPYNLKSETIDKT